MLHVPSLHMTLYPGLAKDKVAMKHLQLLFPFTDRVSSSSALWGSGATSEANDTSCQLR